MLEVAAAAGIGLALGVVTGMPIGVVNVAIVDAATRGDKRFAIGLGIGGALADSVHAAIAFVGVGRVIDEHPSWSKLLAVIAALVIVSYAVFARRPRARPVEGSYGVATGLLLTLPNPAALGAWVAVAAVLWPTIALDPALVPALVLALGVGVGSAIWFGVLAHVIAKLPRDHRVVRVAPTLAAALLVVIALAGVVRAFL